MKQLLKRGAAQAWTYTGLPKATRGFSGRKTVVLASHNLLADDDDPRGDSSLHLRISDSHRQIDWLKDRTGAFPPAFFFPNGGFRPPLVQLPAEAGHEWSFLVECGPFPLGTRGVAMVEFKQEEESRNPTLMEINGRFRGSLHLAVTAERVFPHFSFSVRWEIHRKTGGSEFLVQRPDGFWETWTTCCFGYSIHEWNSTSWKRLLG